MDSPTIRPAAEDDLHPICQLFAEGHLIHSDALPWMFRPLESADLVAGYVLDMVTGDNSEILVAEIDSQVIGFVLVAAGENPEDEMRTSRRYAAVHSLTVTEAYRGLGIGKALMNAAHHWAIDREIGEVELNVWEFNERARSLYESLGYEVASSRMRKILR